MSTLISVASGNLTAAATWALVDATSFSNSESANTALTTSFVASSTFTPGAITVDGIALKIASRAASPSGTITAEIALGGVLVTGATATVNVADLPLCGSSTLEGGWVFLKFAAPVLLVTATAYTVSCKTSSASQVNLFSASGSNWSRMLRTTTTQAPVAGDDMVAVGELTGAGTSNAFTVTMDSTAATNYGSNVTGASGLVTPALAIGTAGTLTFGSSASTNYILQLSGNLIVYAGGALNIGTVATPVPRGSTATLQFNCAANIDFGLTVRNLGTWVQQGLSRTSGKSAVFCKLNANAAANATTLNVDTDTGWLSGDVILVATTDQTAGHTEKGTLNGNAGSTSLTVNGFAGTGGGVANAHGGVSPIVAEVGLLTRNTVVRAVTLSKVSFVSCKDTATYNVNWAEFAGLGSSGAAPCILLATTTGGLGSITNFSIHDGAAGSITVTGAAWNNITLQYGVIYNTLSFGVGGVNIPASSLGASALVDNIIIFQHPTTGFSISDVAGVYTNLTTISNASGQPFTISDPLDPGTGTLSNFTVHGGGQGGFYIGTLRLTKISTISAWRNIGGGLSYTGIYALIDGVTLFGNSGQNIGTTVAGSSIELRNITSNGDTTFATAVGIVGSSNLPTKITINTGDFGSVSGILTAHATGDIQMTSDLTVVANNTKLSSTTQVASLTTMTGDFDGVFATRLGQAAGVSKTWLRNGVIATEATTFHTAAPSEKLTPSVQTAGEKLKSGPALVACASGATKTIGVWINKLAGYVGSQPRLMLKANSAMGVNTDTVLATYSASTGSWNQLTATTPSALDDGAFECYVDCDGSAGAVYVDDWSAT